MLQYSVSPEKGLPRKRINTLLSLSPWQIAPNLPPIAPSLATTPFSIAQFRSANTGDQSDGASSPPQV